ncbi:MAG: hypothetical protein KJP00_13190 [Bacteroidia bacterium]|nr:hypothetical protein [Bacteroidia bacterium]
MADIKAKLFNLHRLVVLDKEDGGQEYFLYSLFNDISNSQSKREFFDQNRWATKSEYFSGSEFTYSIIGELYSGYVFSSGSKTGKYQFGLKRHASKSSDCYLIDGTEWTRDCTEWWVNGEPAGTTCGDWYITDTYSTTICPYSGDDYSGGGGGTPNSNKIEEVEDRLIIEINNPKFHCIYTRMTNSENDLFSQVIGPFGLSSDNNLVFRDAQNRPSRGMCSDYPIWDGCTSITDILDGEIAIYINFNGNPHSLELAATILHEGIHAAIASFMNGCGVDVTLLNSTELIEAYSIYTTNNFADHTYIVNNYITPIANALKELDSINRKFDFYKAIAWGGLRDIGRQMGFTPEEMLEKYNLIALDNQDDCE